MPFLLLEANEIVTPGRKYGLFLGSDADKYKILKWKITEEHNAAH